MTGRKKGGDYCWSPPGARYDDGCKRDEPAPRAPEPEQESAAPDDSSELPVVRDR